MKTKIIGWTTLGAVLIVSLVAIYLSGPRTTDEKQSVDSISKPGTPNAVTDRPDPQFTASGVASNRNVSLAGYNVIAERQSVVNGAGDVEHRRLIRRPGKYPYRILVETLRKDASQASFVRVGSMEMVADHVLVGLK